MSLRLESHATDEDTATLLDLLADDATYSSDYEWREFVRCLHHAADESGVVRPNSLRPLVRGVVKPCRIGAFTHRALSLGLVVRTGDYEISDDTHGRNGGKPAAVMALVGAA